MSSACCVGGGWQCASGRHSASRLLEALGKKLPKNLHPQVPPAYRENATTGSAYRIFFTGQGGEFRHGKEFRVGSVDVALRAVVQTIAMAGQPEPIRTKNQKELDPPFHDLLSTYKNEDPRPQPELAVPVEVVASVRLQDGTEK